MIKIEDLDEFEGTTADMVRAWLRKEGWTVKRADRFREWWEKGAEGEEDGFWLPAEFGVEWFWIHALAAVHGLTVQSLLREINPRMRAGLPSSSAIRAHESGEGWWCAQTPGGILRYGKFTPMLCFTVEALHGRQTVSPHEVATWCFWPCDAHGNKTRRGA